MKRWYLIALCMLTGASQLAQSEISMKSLERPHKKGEFLVTFADGTSKKVIEENIRELGGTILHRFKTNASVLIKIDEDASGFMDSGRALSLNPEITKVALNRIFTINAAPDDPKLSRQYHHDLIQSEKAWEISTGSKEIVAAIIDTGVVYTHPDLKDNYWQNPGETGVDKDGNDKSQNGLDDDENGYIDDFRGWDFADKDNDPLDDHGHGTHCAGSIGASGDNGKGIAGLNWEVSLVGLRFINKSGQGEEADAIKAIEYATMMGFDLTSNSWGGEPEESDEEDLLYKAIEAAGEKDILFIAASGNNGRDTDSRKMYPASYDLENIISVGSSDRSDRMSGFSNYGQETVDLMAPGSSVYSTIKRSWFGSEYGSMSGTSMAAPIVAGAVALIKAAHPDDSAAAIKSRILDSVDPISSVKSKLKTGGRLNLYKALTL